ncbi:MAG: glucokinase [Porticoccaceae bacterium]|jgi:glucokinase|nr:glucokinase [Porticoccaceae bacterium]
MAQAWNLVADIGGTNARFSAIPDDGSLESNYEFHHSVEEYPKFSDLIGGLLAEIAEATGWDHAPTNVCLAVACPADRVNISFTNSHWQFNKAELKNLLGCENLWVINDFEAVAHGITELDDHDLVKLGGGEALDNKPIGILGAGTGLGVAGLVRHAHGYHVIDTEGGHADFAPLDEVQHAVVERLRVIFGRVCLERILSGKGILNVYTALCSIQGAQAKFDDPAQIVTAAQAGSDEKAEQTLNIFCDAMGAAAGNLALTFGAQGGIYIAGGVIPRFQDFFISSSFRSKFEDKGRFAEYMKPIPVYLVTRSNLGLLGAAKKLQQV